MQAVLAKALAKAGRGGETRTHNPSLPKRVRYQLRHAPTLNLLFKEICER